MRFSLVVATVNRTAELARFLAALAEQTYTNFELIVVDQNLDDRLRLVLAPYDSRFTIVHLHAALGVSHARNVGLQQSCGEIVAFPDDDCWYPRELLARVAHVLEAHPDLGGLTGRSVDAQGAQSGDARFDAQAGGVSLVNVWRRTCTYTLFLQRRVVETIGGFDETLGPGAGTPWGGGEDIDYPIRALKAGFTLHYDPTIQVCHPSPPALASRAYQYGAGIGRVWSKHHFPLWYVLYHLIRPLGGSLLSLGRGEMPKTQYHWHAFRGRLTGWRSQGALKGG
jgi:GT2 family glycosyltransferase